MMISHRSSVGRMVHLRQSDTSLRNEYTHCPCACQQVTRPSLTHSLRSSSSPPTGYHTRSPSSTAHHLQTTCRLLPADYRQGNVITQPRCHHSLSYSSCFPEFRTHSIENFDPTHGRRTIFLSLFLPTTTTTKTNNTTTGTYSHDHFRFRVRLKLHLLSRRREQRHE